MKKTYQTPQIIVVKVSTQSIICASDPVYSTNNATQSEGGKSADSRFFDFDEE